MIRSMYSSYVFLAIDAHAFSLFLLLRGERSRSRLHDFEVPPFRFQNPYLKISFDRFRNDPVKLRGSGSEELLL